MREYNDRVLQVEKSSFVPLVFSTNGGMSHQCNRLHKQLALLICAKRGDQYSKIMQHLRTRIRFTILKSTLVAIRGYRGQAKKWDDVTPLSDVDFGVIAEDTLSKE